MGKQNAMDAFLDHYGITKTWVIKNCGFVWGKLDYACDVRGLRPEEVQLLRSFFRNKGKELLSFKFSDNHKVDLEHLRKNFGIKKVWLANKLGLTSNGLKAATERTQGLTMVERNILLYAIKDIARACIDFDVPQELKKAA